MAITKIKDPDEDLDYTWDFSGLLETDETIASYSFENVPDDIDLHDKTNSGTEVTAYVGPGGADGDAHVVTCRIVTTATPPRTFDRSIRFKLQTK